MNSRSIENSINKKTPVTEKKNYPLEVLQKFSTKIEESHIDSILECLERELGHAEEIGEGKNAKVFGLKTPWRELCVKEFFLTREIVNEFDQEYEFQQRVNDLGIRTPENLLAIENKKTKQQYLIMERINGFSLHDLSHGKSEKARKELRKIAPVFFKELEDVVTKMNHENIYHRDLHEGNVMFDVVTKKPVIIDFGHATQAFSSDEDKDIFVGMGYVVDQRTGKRIEARQTFLVDSQEVRKMKQVYL